MRTPMVQLAAAAMIVLALVPRHSAAADLITIPMTIVPGSVVFQNWYGEAPSPVSLPFSGLLTNPSSDPDCGTAAGFITADLIDGGMNVGIEADVRSLDVVNNDCEIVGWLRFEVEMTVPDFEGSSTTIVFTSTPLEDDFSLPSPKASIRFNPQGARSTVLGPHPVEYGILGGELVASTVGAGPGSARLDLGIPGDVLRFTVQVEWRAQDSNNSDSTIGVLGGRFEFKAVRPTHLPELSASLSLPLGMAWLAGMSMMRGGA